MPVAIKANWRQIRYVRETEGVTYRELSERFGVPLKAIAQRAQREGWTVLKVAVAETVAKAIPQGDNLTKMQARVAEKTADTIAAFLAKSVAQSSGIMDAGADLVAQAHANGDARAARDAAACWSMGHTGARTALGLDRPGGAEPTEWMPVGQLLPSPAPVVDVEEVRPGSGPSPS